MALILLVITCLLLHSKHERELEEKRQVQKIIEQVEIQEHQVQEVQEPAPYVYEPREDSYYEELDLLAHLIYSEVGDDGEEAMYYAGSVVLNRMKDGEYPDELYDVIYQKGQYQVTWNGGLWKEEPNDLAYEVAADLLEEGAVIPDDIIYQAEFVQSKNIYAKIGNTYFCGK